MKRFFRKHQSINLANPFRLWHIYRAIGKDVPIGGYEDDIDDPMTTKHHAISPYITEPMPTEKKEKIG